MGTIAFVFFGGWGWGEEGDILQQFRRKSDDGTYFKDIQLCDNINIIERFSFWTERVVIIVAGCSAVPLIAFLKGNWGINAILRQIKTKIPFRLLDEPEGARRAMEFVST